MMTGRCLCGAVTFKAEHVELEHHACHCGVCRRWSGGSGFLGTAATGVTFSSREQLGTYRSSDWAVLGLLQELRDDALLFSRADEGCMP